MKIVLQYKASPGFRRQIADVFGADDAVIVIDEADEAAFAKEMVDADALLHVLKPVTPEVIRAAPRLKLIQKIGVGVNTIALDAAQAAGVAVCNMPGSNSQAVAEMALSLMFAVLRQTLYLDALTRRGQGWRPDAARLDQVGEIGGRTVGLVGFGQSAQRLAPVLSALGARVIYTARRAHADAPYPFAPLPELLERSDIVSLHAPATNETRGMIDADALDRMKPGAVLINTARGELVDEAALFSALSAGRLRGAGLDVFAAEPTPADNPIFALPNVVLAPHVAWLTPETLQRSLTIALENCRRIMQGAPLFHRVV